MNDTTPDSQDTRPARAKEYEDPHYHDDDDDIPQEEGSRPRNPAARRAALRKWPARRRFED